MLSHYTNLFFPVCSLAISILTFILFFSKETLKNEETRIYSKLVVMGLFESILYVFICLVAHFWFSENTYYLFALFNKLLYCIYVFWFTLLFYYIFIISNEKDRNIIKTSITESALIVLDLIIIILIIFNKVEIFYDSSTGLSNSYGSSADILFYSVGLYLLGMVIIAIRDLKNNNHKKYIPLYLLLFLMFITLIIRKVDPFLSIYSNVLSFTVLVMYFTIENPDIKMLEELYKNKKIIERTNQDTSNLLFKLSQDIKAPVDELVNISNTKNDEILKKVNNLSKNLSYMIDDVLDMSSMTTNIMKIYNDKYNPTNLFKRLINKYKNNLKKSVKLEFNINSMLPEYVYGDSIKVKQVISSILQNSVDYTESGIIVFEVNAIIRHGICRFIIDITNDGSCISIDKVNDILSFKEADLKLDFDKHKLDLKEVKILVNRLGGSFMIRSDEVNGTNISITLDQKIVETNQVSITKKLELYEQNLHKNKKIMVIDDDMKELSKVTSILEKKEMNVYSSLFGEDLIDKIFNGYNFDLIILDDETNTYSAYELLKQLNNNENFNTPVVIMIDDNKEFIKLHYLQDGFDDVIMKSKLISEIDRVLKRF